MKATAQESVLGAVVFDAEQIASAVERLAAAITRDYAGEPIMLVGVLKGAILFYADLMRALGEHPLTLDFMVVSSYGSGRDGGKVDVRLLKDLDQRPAGKNVLLVEDIVDEGLTLEYLLNNLRSREPRTLRAVALMDKPFHRITPVPIDYIGLTAPDEFLVGYGLDYQEGFRNLPYICKLKRPPKS